MSLSDEIGTIGNASYFHPLNGGEPTNDFAEVLQVKHLSKTLKELKASFRTDVCEDKDCERCRMIHLFHKKIDEKFGPKLL